MTLREFHNGLRLLRSIDRDEIGYIISENAWQEFRDRPYEFFIRCDDPTANAIWAAMQERM